MRSYRIAALSLLSLVVGGASCPPPPPPSFTISSVTLAGPTELENAGVNSTYTATITITRSPGNTGPISLTSPWWLVDEDSPFGGNDLMSFASAPTFPAGVSTATVTWSLGCVNRTVRGTALTGPGGSPNNPDSGEGNAYMFGPDSGTADVRVQNEGAFQGNAIFVSCMCGGAVCP